MVAQCEHFFQTQHTMEQYQTAFYAPIVADLNNFGTWTEAGAERSDMRATEVCKTVLHDHQPPEGVGDRVERLILLIEACTKAGGAQSMD